MEDDHVDRPGVEERQRLKLTGTNSSIGLIVLIPYIHPTSRMVCQRSRMSGPYGLCSARGRRTTGDAQSRLRASPVGKAQTSQRHRGDDPWIALEQLLDLNVRFADLVVMAERLHPIPFRTRP